MTQKEKQTPLTVKDLAAKVGVNEIELRKLLRAKFSKVGRGKRYSWQPNDPVVQQIIEATQSQTEQPTTQESQG